MASYSLIAATLLGLASAQTPGSATPDNHPRLTTYKCTVAGGCVSQDSAVVLDSASHWIHQKNDTSLGCGNWGSGPDPIACPDEETCAQNCIIESVQDYSTYGVTTEGSNLRMDLYNPAGSVSSPRLYLLAPDTQQYEMLQLTGNEFTFDVNAAKLPCGMNGALYLSEMAADGGRSDLNQAGASYGTGYCDAQCFVTPWINGVGNIKAEGVCCNEMDVFEANGIANALTPHVCSKDSIFGCTGDECQLQGLCDKYGCGDNPYKNRNATKFYGPGYTVDTTRPFTVVTQFPANEDGVLQSIVRKYVQDGKVIENLSKEIVINEGYCEAQGGAEQFVKLGGVAGMGKALSRGMVLAFSIWWDTNPDSNMNWLDSGEAGPCNATEGNPDFIVQVEPRPTVTFSQIKWGEIGSTFAGSNSTVKRWHA